MTTLYVAGPMTGIPDFNYPAFRLAGDRLYVAGFDVLNPVDSEAENDTGSPQSWEWYMRRALRMVLAADGVALLPGWEGSRGALIEVDVAQALKMPTHPIDVWLSGGAS